MTLPPWNAAVPAVFPTPTPTPIRSRGVPVPAGLMKRPVVAASSCATSGGSYADLLTFTANGTSMTAERQTGSASLLEFIKVQATRTGSAGDNFGLTVVLWHS